MDQYGHLLFLASVINKSDSDLANYVLANSYVANSALNVLHWSSKNWNDTKIQIFYEEITRVLKKFPNVESKWNVYDIACYYAEKHNALDEFRNYEARYTGDSTGKTMIDLVLSSHNEFSSFGYIVNSFQMDAINRNGSVPAAGTIPLSACCHVKCTPDKTRTYTPEGTRS